jgi:hypothetical protein
MSRKDDRIVELEELVEHQRECIDWLKGIVENLSGKPCPPCDGDCG